MCNKPFHIVAPNHPKRKRGICPAYGCTNKKAKGKSLCWRHTKIRHKHNNPIAYTFDALNNNAKRRGKEFTLTLEEFSQFCEETNYIELKGRSKRKMSIDRIDSSKGYSRDNIRILRFDQNCARGNRDEDFEDLPF